MALSPESDVPSDPGRSEDLTISDQENIEDLTTSDKDSSELSQETISQISAGEFKLDFEPSFDVVREVELKKALQKKIQKAKTLQCRYAFETIQYCKLDDFIKKSCNEARVPEKIRLF